MINQTYNPANGVYTLTCDQCGHTASDPTLPWLRRWFASRHVCVTR